MRRLFSIFRGISLYVGRAVFLVLAVLLPLLPHPAAADGRPLKLRYLGYVSGLPVFELKAEATLPTKGAAVGAGAYRIVAAFATIGGFANLYPYRMETTAEGKLSNARAEPRRFTSQGSIEARRETVVLTYKPGGKVTIDARPPTRQAQEAAAKGYADRTLDPASMIVATIAAFAARGDCAGRFALFDGVRRYDLDLAAAGMRNLPPRASSYYRGAANVCFATPRLIAGFSSLALSAGLYPESADVWLAAPKAGLPAVPVRVETQNALGPITLDLVDAAF